jgi:spore germination cell wall hydrolase CwlJ-like protein
MEDRRKNLEDRRKRARDRRKNDVVLGSIITLLFRTFVVILLILIFSTGLDIKIMLTDILNQQNTIVVELDKQSIDDTAENRSGGNLGASDRALIERIVMSEAGDERLPIEARMAVAQTIYDRMNDWGDPLQVAIKTYSQKDNGEPTDSVKQAVSEVFDNGMRVYEGGTYQFHDDSVTPYWIEGKIARGSIGKLRFYGGYEND